MLGARDKTKYVSYTTGPVPLCPPPSLGLQAVLPPLHLKTLHLPFPLAGNSSPRYLLSPMNSPFPDVDLNVV